MTVISSLDLSQKIEPSKTKNCKACGLYLNQCPIFDNAQESQVFWLGLSAVRCTEGVNDQPLSADTRSGALIELIEKPLRRKFSFYKTNLVKCLPLKEGKIRYPRRSEMEKCYPNFEFEMDLLKPSVVFLLGKQVASFVMKKHSDEEVILDKKFRYTSININDINYIPVHHPSYVLVYKRKHLNKYIKGLRKLCKEILIE